MSKKIRSAVRNGLSFAIGGVAGIVAHDILEDHGVSGAANIGLSTATAAGSGCLTAWGVDKVTDFVDEVLAEEDEEEVTNDEVIVDCDDFREVDISEEEESTSDNEEETEDNEEETEATSKYSEEILDAMQDLECMIQVIAEDKTLRNDQVKRITRVINSAMLDLGCSFHDESLEVINDLSFKNVGAKEILNWRKKILDVYDEVVQEDAKKESSATTDNVVKTTDGKEPGVFEAFQADAYDVANYVVAEMRRIVDVTKTYIKGEDALGKCVAGLVDGLNNIVKPDTFVIKYENDTLTGICTKCAKVDKETDNSIRAYLSSVREGTEACARNAAETPVVKAEDETPVAKAEEIKPIEAVKVKEYELVTCEYVANTIGKILAYYNKQVESLIPDNNAKVTELTLKLMKDNKVDELFTENKIEISFEDGVTITFLPGRLSTMEVDDLKAFKETLIENAKKSVKNVEFSIPKTTVVEDVDDLESVMSETPVVVDPKTRKPVTKKPVTKKPVAETKVETPVVEATENTVISGPEAEAIIAEEAAIAEEAEKIIAETNTKTSAKPQTKRERRKGKK